MTPVIPDYNIDDSAAPTAAQTAAATADWTEYSTECQENQGKASIAIDGNELTVSISGGVDSLNQWPSTNPAQGTGSWIALDIATGTDDITKVKYNGTLLEAADVAEADLWGFDKGHFVLWIKADVVKTTPKTFTLGGEGETKTFTIKVVDAA